MLMNRHIISLFAVLLFLVGCSNHVSLSGRVTYSDDGTPLEAGTVIFQPVVEPEKFYARGEIREDGKYVLATARPNDGLPPGKYQVYVSSAYRVVNETEVPIITSKYTSAETSGLEVDVDRSTKTFDFQVDRAPGTKQ